MATDLFQAPDYYNMDDLLNEEHKMGHIQLSRMSDLILVAPATANIISKIEKFGRSFKKLTNDTVKAFLVDSKKSDFKI